MADKKKETWSMSVEQGGITTNVKIRKLDNEGYIICVNKYGRADGSKGEYKDESKEYYSATNPLEGKVDSKKEDEETPDIMDIFDKWSVLLK